MFFLIPLLVVAGITFTGAAVSVATSGNEPTKVAPKTEAPKPAPAQK